MTCFCKSAEEHAARALANAEFARRQTEEVNVIYQTEQRKAEQRQAVERIRELSERSPNPDEFKIVDYEQIDKHLVLKVRYPSCVRCSFDQCKVMVFLSVTMKQVLGWTRIDPHFRAGKDVGLEAPSPAARFPASSEGWADAITYAKSQVL